MNKLPLAWSAPPSFRLQSRPKRQRMQGRGRWSAFHLLSACHSSPAHPDHNTNEPLVNAYLSSSKETYPLKIDLLCSPKGCLCLLVHPPDVVILNREDDKSVRILLQERLHHNHLLPGHSLLRDWLHLSLVFPVVQRQTGEAGEILDAGERHGGGDDLWWPGDFTAEQGWLDCPQ